MPKPGLAAPLAIGAAHMVGAEGIPALLEDRGYIVRQIEKTP